MKDKTIVLPEGGGAAATSLFQFIRAGNLFPDHSVVAYDLKPGNMSGFPSSVGKLSELNPEMQKALRQGIELMPCGEYVYNYSKCWLWGGFPCSEVLSIHDKILSYEHLSKKTLHRSALPKRVEGNFVSRKRVSAGCKGTSFHRTHEDLITEYIHPDRMWVVDFNTADEVWLPRSVVEMYEGKDVRGHLHGLDSPLYSKVVDAAKEIVGSMAYHGVGNVQFLESRFQLFFVEMACRVSGSSRMWLSHHVNLLTPGKPRLHSPYVEFVQSIAGVPHA